MAKHLTDDTLLSVIQRNGVLMKPFHYEETEHLQDMNGIQKAMETGVALDWLIISLIICVIGLVIIIGGMIVTFKRLNLNEEMKNKLSTVAAFGVFAFLIGGATFFIILMTKVAPIQSLGYYEADAKVINIEKQEKVSQPTQYHFKLRFMVGHIQDKKTKPVDIITKNRNGIRNGDKVKIKTPQMVFTGGEDKQVEVDQLIKNIGHVRDDVNPEDNGVPKFVSVDEFNIQKQSK
ncbi:hypothetical protein H3966_12015 [Staphylococcus epidermidis]|uniref:hypothetical protein n=2 Tax=Staphylococcus epidermidis TaxID=1282 RepID=UPI00188985DC|nr:hypothetical protein [Staphylococcus epidermidis]MBF2224122.1 hypothetical protein [Staphylococcus epidermidis]MBF2226503.1 hypothetical protein [Staphylococcus epidermidis]